jgi:hypothetical protein
VNPKPPPRENLLINLVCNIALPTFILAKLSGPGTLGPAGGLMVALAFPVGYGVWDFIRRRSANFVSIIGFTSVLLTGGLGLMEMDAYWFAVKEAAVPGIIGLAVLASMPTRRPLVKQFLYNEQVIDVARVDAALGERGQRPAFARLLAWSSYWLAGSFALSAVLNFGLARYLLRSETGTPEFNAELAKMNLLSWPVIVVPSLAVMMFVLWRLLTGIRRLSGLELEQIFRADGPGAKRKAPSAP